MSKKVLLISYYWPPSGGGGVQRWAKMSKYFSDFGWTPIVFVPENPEYPIIDESFNDDVKHIETIKGKIIEPSRILRKFGAKETAALNAGFVSKKRSLFQKLAIAIRSNLFIPDARKWWIKPSVKKLDLWFEKNKVDAIISSGPPHSAHMIALELKKKHNIPWIADFRDPWTNIDFYKEIYLSSWGDKKHQKMERAVLESADKVVCIGPTMATEMSELGAQSTTYITNGFDKKVPPQKLDETFTVLHIGRLGQARNPDALWKVLSNFKKEKHPICEDINVKLVGNVDGQVMESVASNGISELVTLGEAVPNEESLLLQAKSQCLLLLINDAPNATGILPGKLFEYMSTGRPIICLGPQKGDVVEVFKDAQLGDVIPFSDEVKLKNTLIEFHDRFRKGALTGEGGNIEKYSRKNLAEKYCETLNGLLTHE